jgi:hypothetical protein
LLDAVKQGTAFITAKQAAKACLVTFQERIPALSPARSPHRRMSLLHARRFQSHPTCRGPELRCPTTPLEWTAYLPVQLAAIGQADRWGQVMHPPPAWFPAPAYQGSRLWGKGEGGGGGGMVGVLGLPTPLRGLSSNRRRRSSHSAQGCMRRPLERFCPAGDRLDGMFLTHL